MFFFCQSSQSFSKTKHHHHIVVLKTSLILFFFFSCADLACHSALYTNNHQVDQRTCTWWHSRSLMQWMLYQPEFGRGGKLFQTIQTKDRKIAVEWRFTLSGASLVSADLRLIKLWRGRYISQLWVSLFFWMYQPNKYMTNTPNFLRLVLTCRAPAVPGLGSVTSMTSMASLLVIRYILMSAMSAITARIPDTVPTTIVLTFTLTSTRNKQIWLNWVGFFSLVFVQSLSDLCGFPSLALGMFVLIAMRTNIPNANDLGARQSDLRALSLSVPNSRSFWAPRPLTEYVHEAEAKSNHAPKPQHPSIRTKKGGKLTPVSKLWFARKLLFFDR